MHVGESFELTTRGLEKMKALFTNVYLVPAENFILRKIHIGKICKIKIFGSLCIKFL